MSNRVDRFGTRSTFETGSGPAVIYRLDKLAAQGIGHVDTLPFSIKVLLENALRNLDNFEVTEEDVVNIASWDAKATPAVEIPFKPARVVLQDFTGVPVVVDLAALRSAMQRLGGDPSKINPIVPVDLVIDHSVQVDRFGSLDAIRFNAEREFERNRERYEFLHWGQKAFNNFKVVPPATGIVHQVNLEYLAKVVQTGNENGQSVAYPDTLVGTDSHTTMINGLGVLGWGVGGIEAEAAMLGQPIYMLMPQVIGFKLTGSLREGATATDLVLTITQMLRAKGVVGKFVEFYGAGLSNLSLEDKATIANMAPEYGATCGFFPIDAETIKYLNDSGREPDRVALVEAYAKAQGMFRTDADEDPVFTDTLELDLSTVVPSLAGPKRPQDRVALSDASTAFVKALEEITGGRRDTTKLPSDKQESRYVDEGATGVHDTPEDNRSRAGYPVEGADYRIDDGDVVIAAITSCTNTSNPSVLIAAGLVARKAREKGLKPKPWVKTSLAPGSQVVTEYLTKSGLQDDLDALGFNTVGYGCTTCIGNSGPLDDNISKCINDNDLVAVSVLSGNRNFEGRVNPDVRANYLASPPLVVAYSLLGTMTKDITSDPLGTDQNGNPVYLRDIWPSSSEIAEVLRSAISVDMFKRRYGDVFKGDKHWQEIKVDGGETYKWNSSSTYVQNPPYFEDMSLTPAPVTDIEDARVLALFLDSITTDHISPAGSFKAGTPAGKYLVERQVKPVDFNSYGARRGNHEVMMRGTFANIRIRNQMLDGVEGGFTKSPSGEVVPIYDAAMEYKAKGTPLVIFAGKEYGTGSSRDWAAKGTRLLGVRAVIAQSFERIHRSNLVGMGVLPLVFNDGASWQSLGITGDETVSIRGLADIEPRQTLELDITYGDGRKEIVPVLLRIDTLDELEYYRHGGILHYVLRNLVAA